MTEYSQTTISPDRHLEIAGKSIGDGYPCFITFEAGPTHNGLDQALSLVRHAASSGADAIKFQIFNTDKLIKNKDQLFSYSILLDKAHNTVKEITEPLYDILKRRELSFDDWRLVKQEADKLGLIFIATIGFKEEIDFLVQLNVRSVKIASADLDHHPLLRIAARSGMNVQIDTGSSELSEIEEAINILESEGCNSIIIHQCPSGYPARLPSICLNMIKTLRTQFPQYPIAYSDHTPDADMDIAAVALGANLIEKTITLDRCTPSCEHMFSLDPADMPIFVNRIRDLETALGSHIRLLPDSQKENRRFLRRSPYAVENYPAGTPLSEVSVIFRRPGLGLSPGVWDEISSSDSVLSKSLLKDELITHNCVTS